MTEMEKARYCKTNCNCPLLNKVNLFLDKIREKENRKKRKT